ncbi:MAG: hypothetical protein WCI74_08655 [Actinomycetes bacterium]
MRSNRSMVFVALPLSAVLALGVAGCSGSSSEQKPTATPVLSATQSASPSRTGEATGSAAPVSLDPCALVSTEDINKTLSASVVADVPKPDDSRQIVTCTWTQQSPFGIVNIGVAGVPGAEAFKTNFDLAPAYFGGDPKEISVPGADKAYLVINDSTKTPVIGLLRNGAFVLVQIGIEGTTTEQGQALAAQVVSRMP